MVEQALVDAVDERAPATVGAGEFEGDNDGVVERVFVRDGELLTVDDLERETVAHNVLDAVVEVERLGERLLEDEPVVEVLLLVDGVVDGL